MSRLSLKNDFKDGDVLHGDEINTNNNATVAAVNDNFEEILKLQQLKADVTAVDNKLASKVDTTIFNQAIDNLNTVKANKSELETKADKSELDTKASKTELQEGLANKADITYVDAGLANKANTSDVNTALSLKADKTELANKADKSELQTALASKADTSYVNAQLDNKADKTALNNKADTSYVNEQLALKADKTALNNKADTSYVNEQLKTKVNINTYNTDMANKVDTEVIGNLDDLNTSSKDSIVNAINSIQTQSIPIATIDSVGVVKPDGTTITVDPDGTIHSIGGGGSTGGTTDYNALDNKPQIEGNTLTGNKTADDLGLMSKTDINSALTNKADKSTTYTKTEVDGAINTAISGKADTSYVDEQLEDKVDVTTYTAGLANKADKTELADKADTSYVNTQLADKADTSYVNTQLSGKVDTETYTAGLNTKADKSDTYSKADVDSKISTAVSSKADTSYVNTQLEAKADKSTTYTKTEVNSAIDVATSGIDTKLATKANASDVYTKTDTDEKISEAISSKADTSYVNEQLALKADKSDTYTKEEIDEKLDNPTITGDTLPVGSVVEWTGTQTPQNWLLCDGREVSRTTYSELFAAIGTVWGAGDGSTSFNIPDYRDKFVLGAGGEVDLAETGGEKEHTLTTDETPPHTHTTNGNKIAAAKYAYESTNKGTFVTNNTGGYLVGDMDYVGGGQPHNNMPPYVGTYYIIKAKQSAGVVATVVDNLSSTSTTDALSANQGKILNDKINLLSSMCQLMHKNNININGSAWNKVLVKPYTEKVEIGTGLKGDITEGTITIGKNIKTVLIGGSAVINADQPAERYKVSIYCNDEEITYSSYTKTSTNMDFAFAITPYLLSVKENDVITLQITNTSNGQKVFSDIYLNVMTLN